MKKCDVCSNTQDQLENNNSRAYFLCLADIGPTWFKDYNDKCLACALLAETGHGRPASHLELQEKFSLLAVAPARGSSVSPAVEEEGHTGFVWSE